MKLQKITLSLLFISLLFSVGQLSAQESLINSQYLSSFLPTDDVADEMKADLSIPDSAFDFGIFATDGIVMHRFWLYSTGEDTLTIIKAKPHCGCSTAPVHKKDIAPGDSTYVDFYFDSKRLTGLVRKNVTIISNDADNPLQNVHILALTGKPHPFVEATPEVINMGRLSMDKLDKTFVTEIKNIVKEDVHLELIDYSDGYINAELSDSLLAPGETAKLKMTLVRIPNDPRYYSFSATLEAGLNDEKEFRLTIPAVGRINRLDDE